MPLALLLALAWLGLAWLAPWAWADFQLGLGLAFHLWSGSWLVACGLGPQWLAWLGTRNPSTFDMEGLQEKASVPETHEEEDDALEETIQEDGGFVGIPFPQPETSIGESSPSSGTVEPAGEAISNTESIRKAVDPASTINPELANMIEIDSRSGKPVYYQDRNKRSAAR